MEQTSTFDLVEQITHSMEESGRDGVLPAKLDVKNVLHSPQCPFKPYFPSDQPQKFQKVQQIFGAIKVAKIITGLDVHLREEAVNSLVFEEEARLRNPVNGCAAITSNLEAQLKQAEADLHNAKKELATYIGPEAMISAISQSQPVMPQQQQVANPPSVVYVTPHDQLLATMEDAREQQRIWMRNFVQQQQHQQMSGNGTSLGFSAGNLHQAQQQLRYRV
ncbi:hypothetical protein LWI29_013831 [Acer saccharum]|uniref:LOB domain-containing protein n=1 Tax=Acer saccharum TaxID=4024 RepID=A0AA39T4S2_ACESA|nr:hypothetical protein LWI29_013831 [Acer saccharum]